MYIINVNYIVDLSIVDSYLVEHRDYLEVFYKKGLLLCSGPKDPRNGGIIIALMSNEGQVNDFINNDPFKVNGVAEYVAFKFDPVKCHDSIKSLI